MGGAGGLVMRLGSCLEFPAGFHLQCRRHSCIEGYFQTDEAIDLSLYYKKDQVIGTLGH